MMGEGIFWGSGVQPTLGVAFFCGQVESYPHGRGVGKF